VSKVSQIGFGAYGPLAQTRLRLQA
jgi:hypothetical protein